MERVDGRLYIHIREGEDRQLKTPSTRRTLPVHSAVVEAGLEAHIEALRAARKNRVFPKFRRTLVTQASGAFVQWFGKYLREGCNLGRETRLVPYSLRHTLRDLLSERDVAPPLIADILGHAASGMTLGTYGSAASVGRMSDALEAIPFAEVIQPYVLGLPRLDRRLT